MKTKHILSIGLVVVSLMSGMLYISSCQKQYDLTTPNETVFSRDYESLQNQSIGYIVSNVGGNHKMITIGISPQSLYIQDTDTDLIEKLNDAIFKKEIISLWTMTGSGGRLRVIKISKPNADEEKYFREFLNLSNQNQSAKISTTTSFTNYTAVVNAFNHVRNRSCSINNIAGCIPYAYIKDVVVRHVHMQ